MNKIKAKALTLKLLHKPNKPTKQIVIKNSKTLQKAAMEAVQYVESLDLYSNSKLNFLQQKIVRKRLSKLGKQNILSFKLLKYTRKYEKELKKRTLSMKLANSKTNEFQKIRNRENFTGLNEQQFFDKVEELSKQFKFGNCVEQARIASGYLLKSFGIKTERVGFIIIDEFGAVQKNSSHYFAIANLPEGANILKPETWQDAIVIDPWKKFVGSAKEAIKKYKKMFNFNPQTEVIKYMSGTAGEVEKCSGSTLYGAGITTRWDLKSIKWPNGIEPSEYIPSAPSLPPG